MPAVRKVVFWKVALALAVWVILLGSVGMEVGQRFFWSEFDQRQIASQIAHYREMVENDPLNPSNRIALGFALRRQGEYRYALDQFREAIALDENYFDAYLNQGYVYALLGQWDDARMSFERCVELSPEDFQGHFNLGIAYRELGLTEAAFASLEAALLLRPGSADILYNLALTAQREGDGMRAVNYLERALAFEPTFQDALALYNTLVR